MKTIEKEVAHELIVNKSRFICLLYPIQGKNMVNEILEECKNHYKDASHYCYAYIIDGYSKCSDDGEPSGTAGKPMLNILEKNSLEHILCIVIRYFGGIKLGAGGLIRAYSNSLRKTLEKANIVTLKDGYMIEIKFAYENIKKIDYLLKGIDTKKNFDDKVIYSFSIGKDKFEDISNALEKNAVIIKKEKALVNNH